MPYFYYIADQIPIVPEHVWSKISNPVTYADSNPVGDRRVHGQAVQRRRTSPTWPTRTTGSRASPRSPRCCTRRSPPTTRPTRTWPPARRSGAASSSRTSRRSTPRRSPDNHYWFPPIANVSLIPNLTVPGLNNVAVRQAMAYAIDRNKVVADRRVRRRAGRQPDRHRDADVHQLDGHRRREPVQLPLQPGQGEADPDQRGLQDGHRTGSSSPRPASRCRSRSSTSAATRTGSPRCR